MKQITKCKYIKSFYEAEYPSKIIEIIINFDEKSRRAWFDGVYLKVERTYYKFEDSIFQEKINKYWYAKYCSRNKNQMTIVFIPRLLLVTQDNAEKLLKNKTLSHKFNY